MTDGFGRGRGFIHNFGRGMGFGFRGTSPPWPYVGIGRGGLPRCGYVMSGAGDIPPWRYQSLFYARGPAFRDIPPASPQISQEQELDYLRNQAETVKDQLNQIEARIRDLEGESEKKE